MTPITAEQLFISVDRISSELLWSAAQLNDLASQPDVRARAAEVLESVISGLSHTQHQLQQSKENSQNVTPR
jgi:hypothetical protein